MAKVEERPVDFGVSELKGLDEAAATEWWKKRFALVAGVPTDVARAGALLPALRQLSRLPAEERRRATKVRMAAFLAIPADQRQRVIVARKIGAQTDPKLVADDQSVVDGLVSEVPGAADFQREMGA